MKYDGTDGTLIDSSLIMYIDTTPQKDYRAKPKKVDEATLIVEKVDSNGSTSSSTADTTSGSTDSATVQGSNPYAIDEGSNTGKPSKKKAKAPKKSKAKAVDLNDAMY